MGSKACVFVCPRVFSPLCHFDWAVEPVSQFSHQVNKDNFEKFENTNSLPLCSGSLTCEPCYICIQVFLQYSLFSSEGVSGLDESLELKWKIQLWTHDFIAGLIGLVHSESLRHTDKVFVK